METPTRTIEQIRLACANDAELRNALQAADIVPLLMSLVHLTGQARWLDEAAPHIKGGWSFLATIPDEMQRRIREQLVLALKDVASGRSTPATISDELLTRMMHTSVGQTVPAEYNALFREETSFDHRDYKAVPWRKPVAPERLADFHTIIIGAGFSGLGMAIKLEESGIPYTIIEKNPNVGGTWLENRYPGCGVDTPCHFYSYSFAPNPEWSSFFAKRDEILRYIFDCAERYQLRKSIRFGEEVLSAAYDEKNSTWQVHTRTADGTEQDLTARVLITAVGALNRPAIPNIPGLEQFSGPAFHTACWDSNVDLTGKRVAMIGTGASGMQTGPSISGSVDRLTIFQRSPHWAIRHPLYHASVSEEVKWAIRHIPFYVSWFRFQLFWAASDGFHRTLQIDPTWSMPHLSINADNHRMREELVDYIKSKIGDRPDLLAKVIPNYPPFGKRMLRDNHWYDMLKRPNVELVTDKIDRIEANAVVTREGARHEVDVIVLATGFQASRMLGPIEVYGRHGKRLRDSWGDDDPRAYLGITIPDYPNFFMIYGPNTNLAHGGSAIFHSECQIRYVMEGIRELVEAGAKSIECRPGPFETYNAKVDRALSGMVWSHPAMTNWYKNKRGRVVMNSPWRLVDYRNLTEHLDPSDYAFERAG
ncbi:NAD(P)/FAD-dependent oxidoreductase [Bradyrhizobium sp. LHD-71]|uniref:flavin-containing monooxygenase n=1 Tax=Bradyrhizobium sp. LHD-71 TaxID=3072141 RepID=UPI00280CBDF2|nr:NAD(P)/FAD-dependent oxidoreductase [Bradyrhizobium sp. LHD-71]MDQ8727981.1 NAD(P)/FAD-dependent oxidoreductase [Bradyrhizobium sp. LHD-71]